MTTQFTQQLATIETFQLTIDDQQAGHLTLAQLQRGMPVRRGLHTHTGAQFAHQLTKLVRAPGLVVGNQNEGNLGREAHCTARWRCHHSLATG